jgi:hypothetical protein
MDHTSVKSVVDSHMDAASCEITRQLDRVRGIIKELATHEREEFALEQIDDLQKCIDSTFALVRDSIVTSTPLKGGWNRFS